MKNFSRVGDFREFSILGGGVRNTFPLAIPDYYIPNIIVLLVYYNCIVS